MIFKVIAMDSYGLNNYLMAEISCLLKVTDINDEYPQFSDPPSQVNVNRKILIMATIHFMVI
jgi:hypothetical protein